MATTELSRPALLETVKTLVSESPVTVSYRGREVELSRVRALREARVVATDDGWLFGASTPSLLAFIRELDFLFDIFDEVDAA